METRSRGQKLFPQSTALGRGAAVLKLRAAAVITSHGPLAASDRARKGPGHGGRQGCSEGQLLHFLLAYSSPV